MFFILSKLVGILTQPILHPLLLAILGWALSFWRQKAARYVFIAAFILPLIYSLNTVSTFIMRPLENAIQPASMAEIKAADGVIILGGFTGSGSVAESRSSFTLGEASERLILGLSIHKEYPEKDVWITGFSGSLVASGWSEAENTKAILDALNIISDRIKFEDKARNTYQNALYTFEAANPTAGQNWLLITSAAHMPRAAGAFRAAGWQNMMYLPTDFQTTKTGYSWGFNPQGSFARLRSAFHEYIGLVVYWMTGRYTPES